jgi:hypothetical protein
VAIPSCIASGQYLLRLELIALHGGKHFSIPQIPPPSPRKPILQDRTSINANSELTQLSNILRRRPVLHGVRANQHHRRQRRQVPRHSLHPRHVQGHRSRRAGQHLPDSSARLYDSRTCGFHLLDYDRERTGSGERRAEFGRGLGTGGRGYKPRRMWKWPESRGGKWQSHLVGKSRDGNCKRRTGEYIPRSFYPLSVDILARALRTTSIA